MTYEESKRYSYRLTIDHPSSSYGVPVLVRSNGDVFGPSDHLHDDTESTGATEVNAGFGSDYDRDLCRKFLGPATIDDLVV